MKSWIDKERERRQETRTGRLLLLLFLLLSIIVASACGGQKISSKSPAVFGGLEYYNAAIVSLVLQSPGGEFTDCTGTFIGSRLIATARHCVANANENWTGSAFDGVTKGTGNEYSIDMARIHLSDTN